MRLRAVLLTVVLIGAVVGVRAQQAALARPGSAAQVIADAVEAIGGRERILAVKTLTVEGYGKNPNIGQAMTPEAEPLFWMLPDYKRSIDLEHGRAELSFTRRPAFPAVFDNARQVQRLDGDVAYNPAGIAGGGRAGGPATPARLSADVTRDRRVDMLQHPLTLLRAALEPGARVENLRRTTAGRRVDIVTTQGDRLTLAVDGRNRPVSVTTAVSHPNLGDTTRVTTFDSYENLDGVRLPKRVVTTLDRWTEYEIGVMKNSLDVELDLEAPAATRNAPAAVAAAPVVMSTALAPGIWFLTAGGVSNVLVEFTDHLTIVEAPSEVRLQAVLAKAKELVPTKPVTQLILSHHHFDHSAGVRAAVAAGLTIVTHRSNEAWFREAARRTHTLVPDALARKPTPLKIVSVDDAYVMKDTFMEARLYHLVGSTHGDGIVAVYFPEQRIYAEPDVWNPGAQINPHVRSLADDITRRQLRIERIVPLHGNQVQPYAEFEKIVAEWGSRRSTTTTYPPGGGQR